MARSAAGTAANEAPLKKADLIANHGSVSGRVLDAKGRPVAGALVTAYWGREYEREAKSADDGRYAFERLPAGKYHLKAHKETSFTRRLPEYDIQVDPGAKKVVDLALVAGGTLELTIVDQKSRKPVAGAELEFDHPRSLRRTTDKDGKTTLSGLGYDGVEFRVRAEGYVRQMRGSDLHAETEPGKHSTKTIELAPEKTITGRVVDEKDRPLPDAVVTIEIQWEGGLGLRSGRTGDWDPDMTDQKGAFRLGGLEEGDYSYDLTATKEGYASANLGVDSDEMEGVRIVMRPGATVEGIVKDSKGALVKGALVNLGEDRSARSDDKGRFQFVHVTAEEYEIFAEKGEARSEEQELEIGWEDHVRGIGLVLRDKKEWTYTVSGRVVDAMDGKGLQNITVWLSNHADIKTKTDASGRFVFSEAPSGRYEIDLRDIPSPYIEPIGNQDVIVEGLDIQDRIIRLRRGATLQGRVLLPSGEGAWEAKLRLVHPSHHLEGYFGRRVIADSKGRFKVEGMHPAMACRVRADLEGYAPGLSEPFNVRQEDKIEDIVIRLKRPGKLSGTVKDDKGRPLQKGVMVQATFLVPGGFWMGGGVGGRVAPDANGRFELTGLPPGKIGVELSKEVDRGGWSTAQRKTVEIDAGKETTGVDFVMESKKSPADLKGYIAGRVVSIASDEGIQGVNVYASSSSGGFYREAGSSGKATTLPDGNFRITGLLEGTFELRANPGEESGYDSQELEGIPSPSEDIPIVLRRLCAVEGRVVVKGSGQPVEHFIIRDVGSKEKNVRDPQGRFRLEGLQRGSILLRAEAPGVGVVQQRVDLKEGETLKDVVLELHRPWQITGQVVRKKDAKPVAGATVMAESLKRDAKKRSTTDADGRFAISGIFPGTETLYVEHPDYGKPWFPNIETPEDALTHEVVLQLEEPARVKGRVFYEGGLPYDGIEIRLGPGEYGYSREFSVTAESDYQGRYEIFPVPPGEYYLVWSMRDPELGRGGYWGRTLKLESSETRTVDFGVGRAVVVGKVTMNGQPGRLAVVTFQAEPVRRWVQANDGGDYLVYGLEAGRYHVNLHLPGQSDEEALVEKDIDLPEQGTIRMDFEIPADDTDG